MYDGLDRVPIKNMGFRQLRERVQILQDRYDALLRRLGGDFFYNNEGGVDWANIVTPLIRAKINRLEITASLNSESAARIYSRPDKNGFAPLEEDGELEALNHALIYKYIEEGATEYWYWDSNSWRRADKGFSSKLCQTPAGFQLDGTLELKTDTNGRMTVSDSFIKMYPDKNGFESYDPKLQIGYDAESSNNDPVIILGQGSGASFESDVTDDDGNVIYKGTLKTTRTMGPVVRYGQMVIYKTETGLILGGAGGTGFCRYLEIKTQKQNEDDENEAEAGLYYRFEVPVTYFDEEAGYERVKRDKTGEAVKVLLTCRLPEFTDSVKDGAFDNMKQSLATEEWVKKYVEEYHK